MQRTVQFGVGVAELYFQIHMVSMVIYPFPLTPPSSRTKPQIQQ